MSLSRAVPMILLVLLVGGISLLFLQSEQGEAPKETPAGPLIRLAPVLRGVSTSGDPQLDAAILVGRVADGLPTDANAEIRAALVHPDWGARWAGLLAVPRYREPDEALADALVPLLQDDAEAVRAAAASAAGYLGATFPRAIPGLLEAATDASAVVREAALGTLARRSAQHLRLRVFVTGLGDESARCRAQAARGLAQVELGEHVLEEALPELRAALVRALGDESREVRTYAVMALGRVGPAATPDVPAILPLLGDADALVRGQAATALGSIGAGALPALEAALRDEEGPGAPPLLWALRLMGEDALPLLRETLEHPRPLLRVLAAQQLWESGADVERATDTMCAALDGDDEEVLLVAIRVLGRMGTEGAKALPSLERLAGHEKEAVATAARAALERLRTVQEGD